MTRKPRTSPTAPLRCEACGRLPEAPRSRLTVANVATVLPVELLVHAVVLSTGLPYLAKVLVLALSATALVIWVAEPSVRRMFRAWLHAGALTTHRRLHSSPSLWQARLVVPNEPGSLERISGGLARLGVNILSIQVQPVGDRVRDEFVLGAPDGIARSQLESALTRSGASQVQVSPTTPVSLTDGQTRALNLATRVVAEPTALPAVLAELLGAEPVDRRLSPAEVRDWLADGTLLKVPSPHEGPLLFRRTGDPFTAVESGRAHRLAELAEISVFAR